jgi:hypothetical protein
MMSDSSIEERIKNLDIALFARIPSQTTDADRKSLLAVQDCARECVGGYIYLEIGSHLGGSIQPHLLDPKCRWIYSIDKRPASQPDERGPSFEYPDNSTERMRALLAGIDPDGVKKIECIDGDTRFIPASTISRAPNLCFIDGEHTPAAVVADVDFCLKVCAVDATIVFHDAQTVFRGLRSVVARLRRAGRRFSSHAFLDMVYVICLDESPVRNGLARFVAQARKDDLWSKRNDLRLMKWRAEALKERASILGMRLLGRGR